MDQAPGPIIAKEPPRIAKRIAIQGSLFFDKMTHNWLPATTVPATGVHNPTRRSIPAPAPINCGRISANWVARRCATTQYNRATAVTKRWRNSPLPGQPLANVENKRCREASTHNSNVQIKMAAIEEETDERRTGQSYFWGITVG